MQWYVHGHRSMLRAYGQIFEAEVDQKIAQKIRVRQPRPTKAFEQFIRKTSISRSYVPPSYHIIPNYTMQIVYARLALMVSFSLFVLIAPAASQPGATLNAAVANISSGK